MRPEESLPSRVCYACVHSSVCSFIHLCMCAMNPGWPPSLCQVEFKSVKSRTKPHPHQKPALVGKTVTRETNSI